MGTNSDTCFSVMCVHVRGTGSVYIHVFYHQTTLKEIDIHTCIKPLNFKTNKRTN